MSSSTEITPGLCYEVLYHNTPLIAQIVRPFVPNNQGSSGPTRWIARCICVLDSDPVKDGEELDLLPMNIVALATKQELVRRCLQQGWRDINDIMAYLADYGIIVGYGTVGSYKSTLLNGKTKSASNVKIGSRGSFPTNSFGIDDMQLWDRFVERLGGRSRAKAFVNFLRAFGKI